MPDVHKLSVKLGTAEFTAEGSEQTIKEQFGQFLAALQAAPPTPPPPTPPPPKTPELPATEQKLADAIPGGNGNGNGTTPLMEPDQATLDRVFHVGDKDHVSLRVLPRTPNADADALVLILYGFYKLAQRTDVFAPTLMACAKQSGIQIDRSDRVISVNQQYINTAGARRGKRYSLNNRGQSFAQGLLREILN